MPRKSVSITVTNDAAIVIQSKFRQYKKTQQLQRALTHFRVICDDIEKSIQKICPDYSCQFSAGSIYPRDFIMNKLLFEQKSSVIAAPLILDKNELFNNDEDINLSVSAENLNHQTIDASQELPPSVQEDVCAKHIEVNQSVDIIQKEMLNLQYMIRERIAFLKSCNSIKQEVN